MSKETIDLIKDLFEMLKLQKEYSEILNKQIVNINAQIETLKKKGEIKNANINKSN